jgi:RNA polymerase sigma-70 factor (ECF subfamily)
MQPLMTALDTPDTVGTTEQGLVERARRGDEEAFAALVTARLPSTVRTVTAILGDASDARDTAQAVFVQAWRSLPSLRDPEAFSAWFGRIVVNAARSSLRSRRRRAIREIPVSAIAEIQRETPSSEDQAERSAISDRLERAFDRLAPDDRLILWLHHYEGHSLADIGGRLGISDKTAKSRLFAARRRLQSALEAEDR